MRTYVPSDDDRRKIELTLVLVIVVLMSMVYRTPVSTFAVLILYFLPVTLAGFFLGRYRASVTALFCVLAVSVAMWHRADLMDWMLLSVWGSVLGLQSLVIGTLCDDHHREVIRLQELHRTDTLSDELTGVANRRAFEYELARRLTEWNRQRVPLTLVLLDIDHFKRLNDTYGHQAGDVVLRDVAQRIEGECRETDLVTRYGGEEFGVVMPNTPASEGMKVAERVRCNIESGRFEVGGVSVKVSISIGLAQAQRSEDRASLVQRSDASLYASKQAGRNCSHYHDGHQSEAFGAVATRGTIQKSVTRHAVVAAHAYTEGETGLPARRVFVDELRRRLAEVARYGSDLSVLLVQVDDDDVDEETSLEVRAAGRYLVAEQIKHVMRDSDLVAYFDQDQFAVLLPSTSLESSLIPAVRTCQRVARSRGGSNDGGIEIPRQITVSIGITCWTSDDTVATILQRAESALWGAIRDGGNQVRQSDRDGVVQPVLVEA